MKYSIFADFDFYDAHTLGISTRSTATANDDLAIKIASFTWLSLRILSLTKEPYKHALIEMLYEFTTNKNAGLILDDLEIELVVPRDFNGEKGFHTYIEQQENGFKTKNKPYGFGILGQGTSFYGPAAVISYAAFLIQCHESDKVFTQFLRSTVISQIALVALSGRIGISSEQTYSHKLMNDYLSISET